MINNDELGNRWVKGTGTFQSYLMEHEFKKINSLLDMFCRRCQDIGQDNTCLYCQLSHRKHNLSVPYRNTPEPKIMQLDAFTEVLA